MLIWQRHRKSAELLSGGEPIGHADLTTFRERALITLSGQSWTFARQSGGDIAAIPGHGDKPTESPAMVASKHSRFRSRWSIQAESSSYDMKPGSRRTYYILRGDEQLGTCTRTKIFGSRYQIELPESVPLHHQAFLLWIAVATKQRQRRAVAAGANSGGR